MEGTNIFKNSQIIVLGLCIGLATIISSVILSQGVMKVMRFNQEVISVTGSAQKAIKSDLAVWHGSFCRRETDVVAAYNRLKEDLDKVKGYLTTKGIAADQVVPSQITTAASYKKNDEGKDTNVIENYWLTQTIEVRSPQVDKITQVSRESTELINQGIVFESAPPEYFYTQLDQLKLDMLGAATKNAKDRAFRMAQSTGNSVGPIRTARMGVFQITPVNSTEIADYGVNDTTSLEKKVTAVVSANFAIQ